MRTFDLASAYRQVGLSERGRRFAYLRVYNPDAGCANLFKSLVLPFGAVRSVHSFLRLARAVWWLGVTGCLLIWTSFYDDYISFSRPKLIGSTEKTIVALFKLLGWIFAEDGEKARPFDVSCAALGVSFNLEFAASGKALVCNTDSRCTELCEEIEKTIEEGKLMSKQAQRLRGRMQFAESQLYGRTGKRCLRVLADFAEGRRSSLTSKDVFFLRMFHELLTKNIPREVTAPGAENLLIFTDACYEPEHPSWPCGLGGVTIHGGNRYFFSLALDAEVRALLGEGTKKQIIFEAETLAALLAVYVWKDLFGSGRVVLFVDNEGTKFSLLKGLSDNELVDRMAELFARLECAEHVTAWIARVPSKSNIADPPSRGEVDGDALKNAIDVSASASTALKGIVSQFFEKGEMAASFDPT